MEDDETPPTLDRCATENELLAFADGQLEGPLKTQVERHIDTCSECAELLAEVLRVDTAQITAAHGPAGEGSGESAQDSERLHIALEDPTAYGQKVGRYVLLRRLGAGGMGLVYAAYDPELRRTIALKLIRPEFGGDEGAQGSARARFLREAQASARLKHANVVTVYETGEVSGVAFIAMEYVEGQTVRGWMTAKSRPHPWREVLRVFLQAGEGLAAAHRAGVLHRDLKPDNILLDGEGTAKVADFGLAVGLQESAGQPVLLHEPARIDDLVGSSSSLHMSMTQTGMVLGSPAYMAPEQHVTANVDARADLYSFSASLYEALYGARPFVGKTVGELLTAKRELKLQSGPRARVPGWVRAVILRGLRPNPDDRWSGMEAMLAALRANPAPRRMLIGAAAAAVAITAGVLGLQAYQRSHIAEACRAEGRAIYEVWNETRSAAGEEGFKATGLAYAADSWSRAHRGVDAYVDAYAKARTELCRAGDLDGSVPPELLARARECLDSAYFAIDKTVRGWESADELMVTRAPAAASAFPALEDCTSIDVLARRLALERSDAAPEEYAALRGQYRESRRLNHEGNAAAAVESAQAVEAQAVSVGALSLASAASLTLCDALGRLERSEEAAAACTRSYLQAVESSDHEGAVHSAAAMSNIASQRWRDRRAAELWLDLASVHNTLVPRSDDGPDPESARLHTGRAYLAQDFAENELAIAEFRRAIDLYTEVYGDSVDLASYLWMSVAHISLRENDFATARDAVDHASRIRDAIYGPDHPMTLEIGFYRALAVHGTDPEGASELFDAHYARMVELLGPESSKPTIVLGSWILETWDDCAHSRARAEEAIAALARFDGAEPEWLAELLIKVGSCQLEDGDATKALRSATRALVLTAEDPPAQAEGDGAKAEDKRAEDKRAEDKGAEDKGAEPDNPSDSARDLASRARAALARERPGDDD